MTITLAAAGRPGRPGSKWLAVSGHPPAELGINGDFAIDISDVMNVVFYGPKAGGAWPDAVRLSGQQGRPGDPGAVIFPEALPGQFEITAVNGLQSILAGLIDGLAARIRFDALQTPSPVQKAQARQNIGADDAGNLTTGTLDRARLPDKQGFRANNGSTQVIAAATLSKVAFTNTARNDGSYYSTSTSRWIPPAGAVLITAAAAFVAGLADANICLMQLYKNGLSFLPGAQLQCAGNNTLTPVGAWYDEPSGTDYYEIFAYGGGAGSKTISDAGTFFEGVIL